MDKQAQEEQQEVVDLDEVKRALVNKGVVPAKDIEKHSEEQLRAKHADMLENPPAAKPFVWMVNKQGKRVTALEEDALAMEEHCEHSFESPADRDRLLGQKASQPAQVGGVSSFVQSEESESSESHSQERHSRRSRG